MTVILDYGLGNLTSVMNAVRAVGHEATVQADLKGADRLILPGVGAFGAAMERLRPLAKELRQFASSGSPLLGVCLGQQLLMERSEEMGEHIGLGIIGGDVRYLPSKPGLKVPHIGWSPLCIQVETPFFRSIDDGSQVYFVHSLVCHCSDPSDVAATAEYGEKFVAAIVRDNVWATQFHPEKSGQVGLELMRRFLEWN